MTSARRLRRLLLRARATAFGRAHDFAGAARDADPWAAFRARVPLQSRETLAPWLAAARDGTPDVLWPGVMRHFAVSSGTTAAGTHLPRTPTHLRLDVRFARRAGRSVLPLVLRGLPSARVLSLPGQVGPDPHRPDALTGEISGLVARFAPPWVRAVQAVAPGTLDALPWERRLERAVEIAIGQDVRALVLVPSWAPVLADLVRDAHRRATGRRIATLREAWPNLGAVVTGGVALASYRPALEAQVGGDRPVRFVETYGASEGFFAYQTGDADDADGSMALDTDSGVVFEFVPFDRLGDPDAPRHTVETVPVGVRVVPHVSTASGLWAYAVGDVVRFTRPWPRPRLVVTGRTREVMDRHGEAVHADDAAAALEAACASRGLRPLHWHVGADASGPRPRHRWAVALDASPSAPDPAALATALDVHLRSVNRHYAIRRASAALAAPEVHLVPEAAFRAVLAARRRGAGGTLGAQSKLPRVADEVALVEALVRAGRP